MLCVNIIDGRGPCGTRKPYICIIIKYAYIRITLRLLLIAGTNFSEFSGNQQNR